MSCSIIIHFLHILSVFHGYGQSWKILGLKLWQLSLILKCDCLRVQLDLEGCGWLVLFANSIAKLGSLPACLALMRALLIVWIFLSIKAFDFWNFGDDVMWLNCNCWTNSLNASLEYCGPLSLTTLLGIPCSENICFIVDMTILLVVRPFIFRIIGNLL